MVSKFLKITYTVEFAISKTINKTLKYFIILIIYYLLLYKFVNIIVLLDSKQSVECIGFTKVCFSLFYTTSKSSIIEEVFQYRLTLIHISAENLM